MKCSKAILPAGALILCSTVLWAPGCAPAPIPAVPVNIAEYEQLQQTHPQAYPRNTIVSKNYVRAYDKQLPMPERVASMELVVHLGGGADPESKELAAGLAKPDAPPELRELAMRLAVNPSTPPRKAPPAGPPRKAPPTGPPRKVPPAKPPRKVPPTKPPRKVPPAKPPPEAPDPRVLARLVTFWARDRTASEKDEERYRQTLTKISGRTWDRALVDAINLPNFNGKGSALHLLQTRVRRDRLCELISETHPQTDAMAALAIFVRRLDYIPRTRLDFLATVYIYKTRQDMIADAAAYSRKWDTPDHKYAFGIRDFHLLSRLARDPLQEELRRTDLILRLGKELMQRQHVPTARGPRGTKINDRFRDRVEELAMADLWNLWLLNGMLGRDRMQMALRVMAERDRLDRRRAWGGLVFYRNGRAEAQLYESAIALDARSNDLIYVPGTLLSRHSHDALCRFAGHFERLDNTARAGPTRQELGQAKEDNYYGLILTSLGPGSFCAHYYNPEGVVVSLGRFPFRR